MSNRPASLPSSVRFVGGKDTLPCVDIDTAIARARVYFHGAHVAAWHPSHATAPVLWLSGHSFYQPGKPIRGGVPICFPWFGPHPSNAALPAHGLARLAEWTLIDAHESRDGTVELTFTLTDDDPPAQPWPHAFQITYRIVIGAELTMEFSVRNTGAEPFSFEEALHTYVTVEDIERVAITGLESAVYLDKTAGFAERTQPDEPIRFTGETDRAYVDTIASGVIHDAGLRRRVVINKNGSRSTVVWNPWIEKARAMPDFGNDEWRRMVCVETANIGPAAVRLDAGATHTMMAEISVAAT